MSMWCLCVSYVCVYVCVWLCTHECMYTRVHVHSEPRSNRSPWISGSGKPPLPSPPPPPLMWMLGSELGPYGKVTYILNCRVISPVY